MVDATVVGSGPNGLAAAVTLAHAGLSVRVIERASTIGGGLRTSELTLPGFRHDVGSAVHPGALESPFFREWGLRDRVPYIIPDVSYAHPFDDVPAALAYRDLGHTAEELGVDGRAWRSLLQPLVDRLPGVVDFTTNTMLRLPTSPFAAVLFGLRSFEQGSALWNTRFRGGIAPALLTGAMAHSTGAMPSLGAAGAGLLLAVEAHGAGWGVPIGGSQSVADALAADLVALGGEIVTGHEVHMMRELEPSRIVLLDTSPEFLARFTDLPSRYRNALLMYKRGAAIAKVDFALDGPVPWADARVALSPTVHLGGSRAAIAASEQLVNSGRVPDEPYVLVVQPTVVDPSRAPIGRHVLWAYIHVPRGSSVDPTELITRQVERFAPGFRDRVLAAAAMSAAQVELDNPTNVGGEMTGGAVTLAHLVRRPVLSPTPWHTPAPGVYLCSAATPPGPAVHGMAGWHAARLALRDHFGIRDFHLSPVAQ